jgi:internalin A
MSRDTKIHFECPYLEKQIRQEFLYRFGSSHGDRAIIRADMAKLNEALSEENGHFVLNDCDISDITPLVDLSNLKSLFVNSSRIKDFSSLNVLPKFIDLTLGPAAPKEGIPSSSSSRPRLLTYTPPSLTETSPLEIVDLTPLAGLNNLESLNMVSLHHIRDVSPLAGLLNLRELRLSGYSLTDYSPLYGLKNLEELFLPFCQLTDPAPLAKLNKLKCLTLLRSKFTDQ